MIYCATLPENNAKHLTNHVHLGFLEVLSTFAKGSQDTITTIVAHARETNNL